MVVEELLQEDKRRLARRQLIYYLKVIDQTTGQPLGRLADVHTEGLLVMTEAPLPQGWDFRLLLELPKSLARELERDHIVMTAQVQWSRPGKNPSFSESGLQFTGLDEPTRVLIDRLIKEFEMPGA